VSWHDVQHFLKLLNEKEIGKGWEYRLPSEAEWEYACRNAASTKEECSFDFYSEKPTNDLSSKQANFNGNYLAGAAEKGPNLDRPTKVGSYAPNRLGLYDMHGNILQWCADLFSDRGPYRVIRGSGWFDDGRFCRVAHRRWGEPWRGATRGLGVRLARVPSGK